MPEPRDPSFARRFLREARVAGSLNHPNIVTVHDYFEAGGPLHSRWNTWSALPAPLVNGLTLAQIGGVLRGVLAGSRTPSSTGSSTATSSRRTSS